MKLTNSFLDRLNVVCQDHKLLQAKQALLVGVSGGVDSVVLCHALNALQIPIAIAHCNFKLRGYESDGDELFVENFASSLGVKFHTNAFETKELAKKYKMSIQQVARQIRYTYFNEIINDNQYKALLTAHHLNDAIETFFINLVRGTGIDGLTGIKNTDGIYRPLINFTKDEIINYANENKLHWREDSSNQSTDYLRNKIRLKIIPEFLKLNPAFENHLMMTMADLEFNARSSSEQIIQTITNHIYFDEFKFLCIKTNTLRNLPDATHLLFHFLKSFGFTFNDAANILNCKQSGKTFETGTTRVITDRGFVIVDTLGKMPNVNLEIKQQPKQTIQVEYLKIQLKQKKVKKDGLLMITAESNVHYIDEDALSYPLTIRNWREGDAFKPLGMKKMKKISDYFIDNKYSQLEKESSLLLVSGDEIVCILGERIDDRFKVTNHSLNLLVITVELSS